MERVGPSAAQNWDLLDLGLAPKPLLAARGLGREGGRWGGARLLVTTAPGNVPAGRGLSVPHAWPLGLSFSAVRWGP